MQAGQRLEIPGLEFNSFKYLYYALTRMADILEGSIQLNGLDINSYSHSQLRSEVSLIHSKTSKELFKNSLKFNIDPANSKSDAYISELITNLGFSDTKGCNTLVEEGGRNLS